jgi:hypothetical protein
MRVPAMTLGNGAGAVSWISQSYFGLCDPMDGHRQLQVRTSDPVTQWLRSLCCAVDSAGMLGTKVSAGELAEICLEQAVPWPLGKDPRAGQEAVSIGRWMKSKFKDSNWLDLESYGTERTLVWDADHSRNVPSYKFTRTDGSVPPLPPIL